MEEEESFGFTKPDRKRHRTSRWKSLTFEEKIEGIADRVHELSVDNKIIKRKLVAMNQGDRSLLAATRIIAITSSIGLGLYILSYFIL